MFNSNKNNNNFRNTSLLFLGFAGLEDLGGDLLFGGEERADDALADGSGGENSSVWSTDGLVTLGQLFQLTGAAGFNLK